MREVETELEEPTPEQLRNREAFAKWDWQMTNTFGLTGKDVLNINTQLKENPDWRPTSNSGKKTLAAFYMWLQARPVLEEKKEE